MQEIISQFLEAARTNNSENLKNSLREIFSSAQSEYATTKMASRERKLSLKKPLAFMTFDIANYSLEAAEFWSRLTRESQGRLNEIFLSLSFLDPCLAVANIYKMFSGLLSLPQRIASLEEMSRKILANQERMLEELATISANVERVGVAIDEQVRARARKGLIHLTVAANSESPIVRQQNLQTASSDFVAMIALDSKFDGASGHLDSETLALLGHWGYHLCLGMQEDRKSAIAQIYESVKRFPERSLEVFGVEYFSYPYRDALRSMAAEEKDAKEKLKVLNAQNSSTENWAIAKNVGRHVGGVIVGAGAGAVAGLLGSLAGAPYLSLPAWYGTYHAIARSGSPPKYLDPSELNGTLTSLEEERKLSLNDLREECSACLKVIQPLSLVDLNGIRFT